MFGSSFDLDVVEAVAGETKEPHKVKVPMDNTALIKNRRLIIFVLSVSSLNSASVRVFFVVPDTG